MLAKITTWDQEVVFLNRDYVVAVSGVDGFTRSSFSLPNDQGFCRVFVAGQNDPYVVTGSPEDVARSFGWSSSPLI